MHCYTIWDGRVEHKVYADGWKLNDEGLYFCRGNAAVALFAEFLWWERDDAGKGE